MPVKEAVFLEIAPVGPELEEPPFSRPDVFGRELHREGKFRLAYVFNDHMVLQRAPERALVWGWCDANDQDCEVLLEYEKISLLATLESSEIVYPSKLPQMRWSIELPLQQAGGPITLWIFNSQGEGLTVEDVYFGDVYHCAGQSNMLFTVAQTFIGRENEREGELFDFPLIRVMDVGRKDSKEEIPEMENPPAMPWTLSTNSTVRDVLRPYSQVSAVCWFFGRAMHEELKVPIGLITMAADGSPLQAWSHPLVFEACGESKVSSNPCCPTDNSLSWFGMAQPVARIKTRAVLWYQGESNVIAPEFYACAFPFVVEVWRKLSGQPNLPFVVVGLAPIFLRHPQLENFRAVQMNLTRVPHVHLIPAYDKGDASSPFDDLHPRDKKPIGERISWRLLEEIFHSPIQSYGPTVERVQVEYLSELIQIDVIFERERCGKGGLEIRSYQCPTVNQLLLSWAPMEEYCVGFEAKLDTGALIQLEDLKRVEPNVIRLSFPRTSLESSEGKQQEIAFIQFGWCSWPKPILYSSHGLPVIPFSLPVEKRK